MVRRYVANFALAVFLLVPCALHPASFNLLAKNASEAYASGRYKESAKLYLIMTRFGFNSAQVHYDLGNAYLKQGNIGRAILEYRRALKTDPGLAPARHNLSVARSLLTARVAAWEPSPWAATLRKLSPLLIKILVLVFVFLGNAALCTALLLNPGRLRRFCVQGLITAFILAGALLGLMVYSEVVLPSHLPAVVVTAAPVYPTPEANGKPLSILPAGSEIMKVNNTGAWCFVIWGEGRGWTKTASVEVP